MDTASRHTGPCCRICNKSVCSGSSKGPFQGKCLAKASIDRALASLVLFVARPNREPNCANSSTVINGHIFTLRLKVGNPMIAASHPPCALLVRIPQDKTRRLSGNASWKRDSVFCRLVRLDRYDRDEEITNWVAYRTRLKQGYGYSRTRPFLVSDWSTPAQRVQVVKHSFLPRLVT